MSNSNISEAILEKKKKMPDFNITIIASPLLCCYRKNTEDGFERANLFTDLHSEKYIELFIRKTIGNQRHFLIIDEKQGWLENRHNPADNFSKRKLKKMKNNEIIMCQKVFHKALEKALHYNSNNTLLLSDTDIQLLVEGYRLNYGNPDTEDFGAMTKEEIENIIAAFKLIKEVRPLAKKDKEFFEELKIRC